jgi:hypothetical protein
MHLTFDGYLAAAGWEKVNPRAKGEPIERVIVIGAITIASALFLWIPISRLT